MRKNIIAALLSAVLCIAISLPVFSESIPEERQLSRFEDYADLLSDSQETFLRAKLDSISERRNCDVVIVTVNSLDGKSAQAYADDFYDYNGYGMDTDDSGILLLISMERRDWAISTYGRAISAFTDYGQKYIINQIIDDLGDDDFDSAFNDFANLCDDFIAQAQQGEPFDVDNEPMEPLSLIWIPMAIVIGIIIAAIVTGVMKGKLKSVRSQPAARSYIKANSLNLTRSDDIYLYRNVSRVRRESSSGSGSRRGGGSSTHRSSSGRSHGGSSGRF